MLAAHRVSWEIANGSCGGLQVHHTCDNPPCCNPAHLFPGTQAENMRDMDDKGRRRWRAPLGTDHGRAKLSEAEVSETRSLSGHAKRSDLAIRFRVGLTTIGKIQRRETWTHV